MMIRIVVLLLSSLSVARAGQPDSSSDRRSGETALLRHRAAEWREAYNSGDPEKLARFYAEDADYVSPHVDGLLLRGRAGILENFRQGVIAGGRIDSVEVVTDGVSCDLAWMLCTYHATNAGVSVTGRNVLVLRNIAGEWLIITHASIVRD